MLLLFVTILLPSVLLASPIDPPSSQFSLSSSSTWNQLTPENSPLDETECGLFPDDPFFFSTRNSIATLEDMYKENESSLMIPYQSPARLPTPNDECDRGYFETFDDSSIRDDIGTSRASSPGFFVRLNDLNDSDGLSITRVVPPMHDNIASLQAHGDSSRTVFTPLTRSVSLEVNLPTTSLFAASVSSYVNFKAFMIDEFHKDLAEIAKNALNVDQASKWARQVYNEMKSFWELLYTEAFPELEMRHALHQLLDDTVNTTIWYHVHRLSTTTRRRANSALSFVSSDFHSSVHQEDQSMETLDDLLKKLECALVQGDNDDIIPVLDGIFRWLESYGDVTLSLERCLLYAVLEGNDQLFRYLYKSLVGQDIEYHSPPRGQWPEYLKGSRVLSLSLRRADSPWYRFESLSKDCVHRHHSFSEEETWNFLVWSTLASQSSLFQQNLISSYNRGDISFPVYIAFRLDRRELVKYYLMYGNCAGLADFLDDCTMEMKKLVALQPLLMSLNTKTFKLADSQWQSLIREGIDPLLDNFLLEYFCQLDFADVVAYLIEKGGESLDLNSCLVKVIAYENYETLSLLVYQYYSYLDLAFTDWLPIKMFLVHSQDSFTILNNLQSELDYAALKHLFEWSCLSGETMLSGVNWFLLNVESDLILQWMNELNLFQNVPDRKTFFLLLQFVLQRKRVSLFVDDSFVFRLMKMASLSADEQYDFLFLSAIDEIPFNLQYFCHHGHYDTRVLFKMNAMLSQWRNGSLTEQLSLFHIWQDDPAVVDYFLTVIPVIHLAVREKLFMESLQKGKYAITRRVMQLNGKGNRDLVTNWTVNALFDNETVTIPIEVVKQLDWQLAGFLPWPIASNVVHENTLVPSYLVHWCIRLSRLDLLVASGDALSLFEKISNAILLGNVRLLETILSGVQGVLFSLDWEAVLVHALTPLQVIPLGHKQGLVKSAVPIVDRSNVDEAMSLFLKRIVLTRQNSTLLEDADTLIAKYMSFLRQWLQQSQVYGKSMTSQSLPLLEKCVVTRNVTDIWVRWKWTFDHVMLPPTPTPTNSKKSEPAVVIEKVEWVQKENELRREDAHWRTRQENKQENKHENKHESKQENKKYENKKYENQGNILQVNYNYFYFFFLIFIN